MVVKKIKFNHLDVNADLKPLSDLNVEFYDQDINTSVLRFKLTYFEKGIDLSSKKINTYIFLVAEDGSKVSDYLAVFNETEGIVSYTIPKDFLKHTGRVRGQVYLYQQDNIIVTREFSFMIKASLVKSFSSETKVEYIKTFDDLETVVKSKVIAIEEAIKGGTDYVSQMIETVKNGEKIITDVSNNAITTVTTKTDTLLQTIADNNVALKKDTYIYTDGNGFSREVSKGETDWYKITDAGNYSITKEEMSINAPPKGDSFNLIVNTSSPSLRDLTAVNSVSGAIYTNVLSSSGWSGWKQLLRDVDTSHWQKQATTNEDGTSINISGYNLLDVEDIKNFDGYVTSALNAPINITSGYVKRKYRSGYIEIVFAPHSRKQVYRNSYNAAAKVWVGWEKNVNASELAELKGTDTGWQPLKLINGVTASVAPMYRLYSNNNIYSLSFKGTMNAFTNRDTVIAKLPSTVIEKLDRSLTFLCLTSVNASTARFNRWIVELNGDVKFTASNYNTDGSSGAWNPLDITLTI